MTNPTDKQSDIVAELRALMAACDDYTSHPAPSSLPGELIDKASDVAMRAADELERLRASNEAMRQVLQHVEWAYSGANGGHFAAHHNWMERVAMTMLEVRDALSHSATKEPTE